MVNAIRWGLVIGMARDTRSGLSSAPEMQASPAYREEPTRGWRLNDMLPLVIPSAPPDINFWLALATRDPAHSQIDLDHLIQESFPSAAFSPKINVTLPAKGWK